MAMRAETAAFVLVLALSAGAARAQEAGSSLTLQSAADAPAHRIIDGVDWVCQGAVCAAAPGGLEQPAARACRRVVRELGPVTAFTWQGETLTPQQVAACDAAAAGKR
jgi:hypothetical protein